MYIPRIIVRFSQVPFQLVNSGLEGGNLARLQFEILHLFQAGSQQFSSGLQLQNQAPSAIIKSFSCQDLYYNHLTNLPHPAHPYYVVLETRPTATGRAAAAAATATLD